MTIAEIITLAIKLSIIGLVFGLGLRSRFADFGSLLGRPGLLARAFLSVNVVMPLFAVIAVRAFDLRLELAVALVALSLAPVPPLLPGKQVKAGGGASLAVALFAVLAAISIIWIPLAIGVIGNVFDRDLYISPAAVAKVAAILVILPLLAGIALRRLAEGFADSIEPAVSRIALVALLLGAILIIVKMAPVMWQQVGDGTLAVLGAFVVVGLLFGHLLGGPAPQDRTDIALATASRHPGIALAIAQLVAPEASAVTPLVALFLIVNAVLALPYVRWRAKLSAASSEVFHEQT